MSTEPASPDLSIYLSSLNGVDTAARYASACEVLGGRAVVCAEPHVAPSAAAVLSPRGVEVRALPPLADGRLLRQLALLRDFGSSLNMGDNPANARTNLPSGAWKAALVRGVRRMPGKPSPASVNRWLKQGFGHRFPNTFASRHVLVISFPLVPARLLNPELVVDTVVDSWDHPVRRTAGYVSRLAIAWNEDLGLDWQRFQGAEEILIGPPVKLEYALNAAVEPKPVSKTMMYPVATSPHYPAWFKDELALVDAVAAAADRAGWRVLVKPKPESTPEELSPLLARSNVFFGRFHESFGALDYHLGDEYNRDRLAEVHRAELVVNALTTFGLDAACASVPLLQLDLRSCSSLPTLSGVAANHHLQSHLYRVAAPAVIKPSSLEALTASLAGRLRTEPGSDCTRASDDLRDWASPGLDADLGPVMARVLAD